MPCKPALIAWSGPAGSVKSAQWTGWKHARKVRLAVTEEEGQVEVVCEATTDAENLQHLEAVLESLRAPALLSGDLYPLARWVGERMKVEADESVVRFLLRTSAQKLLSAPWGGVWR